MVNHDKNDSAPEPKKALKKKGGAVYDIWGGKDFGFYQLVHYILSVIGLGYYLAHCLLKGAAGQKERVLYYGTLELVLLLTRFGNEVYFGKWGVGDVLHHLTMVLSFYLVNCVDACREFGWVMCQMQVLHVPMLLWYMGCRRNCHATSKAITGPCVAAFPFIWIASTAYRAAILLSAGASAWAEAKYVPFAVIASFGLVLAHLDVNWSAYFLKELRWFASASPESTSLGIYLGAVVGACATIVLSR